MAWTAENLQFVVFHHPTEQWDAFQVWLEIFKAPPDSYQKHPDPNTRQSNASGSHAGFSFQVQCALGRIDLVLAPNDATSAFPAIKDHDAGVMIHKHMAGVLAATKSCVRLALVAQLFEDCKSLPDANKKFAALAHQRDIPSGASDLTFGMNMRKQYTNDGFVINRLMRWTSLVKQIVQFAINNGKPEEGLPVEQPAVILNLDINTVMRHTPFKSAVVPTIIGSLFAEYEQLRGEGIDALVR